MSSYIVTNSTINKVVSFLSDKMAANDSAYRITLDLLAQHGYDLNIPEGRRRLATQMHTLNVSAVISRYGSARVKKAWTLHFEYQPVRAPSPIATYKALTCWWYQCTEGAVPSTPLYQLMARIRDDFAHNIVSALPDYDAAPWG